MGKFFSRDIAHAIENFLHDDNWDFRFEEKQGLFHFGSTMGGGMRRLDLLIDVKRDAFLTFAIAPLSADAGDPQMMARMAEFITRANCGLKNGCFEMDYEDGELRFRSYVDCDHQVPSAEVIKNSIYVSVAMFKRYGPGMLEIIFLGANAEETIDKCERDLRSAIRPAPSGDARDDQGGDASDGQDGDASDGQDGDADDDRDDIASDDQDGDARDGQDGDAGDGPDGDAGDGPDGNAWEDQDGNAWEDQDGDAGDDQDGDAGNGPDGNAWEDQDGDAGDGQDSEVDAMFARLATRFGS